ncbi:MAG: hypothetical protein KGL59_15030, partial [Acidobacteriota bacterium]|nr:hypothetical protein [Acidobacteriota bacterium]
MRKFAKVALFILVVAAFAWASDPWEGKPYQQWDMKDVQKVMNDSPWSRTIHVATGFALGSQATGMPRGAGSQGPGPERPSMGQPGGGPPSQNSDGEMESAHMAMFEVRWISAQTMREALARASILDGRMTQADIEQYLAKTPANYELALFGPNMSAFAGATEASLTKDSYLELKSAKKKVAPASVNIQRSGNGQEMAITFDFPKTVNGQPTIEPNEKEVDFVCKAKSLTLKFRFEPKKMMTKSGPD